MRGAILLALLTLALVAAAPSHAGYKERNARIIRIVFGDYGDQAVRVASCESGLTIGAQNGQYLGLFQMGSYARSTYGHSWNPWGQARAAYRYFVASGKDWSPWSCKPW
jgi:hypothetical protein